jgi:quercetin dioxygenase-like cupin family protein
MHRRMTGARMPNSSPDETSERKRRAALRRRLYVTGAAIAVGLAAVVFVLPSAAQEPPPPPIASEFLTARSVFTDDIRLMLKLRHHHGTTRVVNVPDPSRTVVGRFTLQSGAQFPWHTHAGPVVVNIVTGALTYQPAETCDTHTYTAGQAFVDPGQGHVHTAWNPTNAPMTFVATFFDAPAEGPLLIPAPAGNC